MRAMSYARSLVPAFWTFTPLSAGDRENVQIGVVRDRTRPVSRDLGDRDAAHDLRQHGQ
jgi:hypothetical protein